MMGYMSVNNTLAVAPELGDDEHEAIAKITAKQQDLRHRTYEPRRWVGSMRRQAQAAAILGSSKIEGHVVSQEDAEAIVDGRVTSESIDHTAVRAYQRAMTFVLQAARDPHFEYSPGVLKAMQFMINEFDLDAHPGRFRDGGIFVVDTATGVSEYTGPDPDHARELVAALCDHLNRPKTVEPMVEAAMAHYNLVKIHPFKDGNGRMSRILQTLVLARSGILVPEFVSIEEYLGNYTQGYYEILRTVGGPDWAPERDTRLWIRYCLTAHFVQAELLNRRVREAELRWELLEQAARDAGIHERCVGSLIDAAAGKKVTNSSYLDVMESSTGESMSKQSVTKDLNALVAAGLIEQRGAARGSHYVATAKLTDISGQARSEIADAPIPALFA